MMLQVKKLYPDSKLPERAHASDAGLDVFAYTRTVVPKGAIVAISTGFAATLPLGYVALVWDKSSIASRGIKTLGGVIDAGYTGEYKILVSNLGDSDYIFEQGQKVAQILVQQVAYPEVVEVMELPDSTRGEGAFGSTGV
jgi:dUTP pyrophosphatase